MGINETIIIEEWMETTTCIYCERSSNEVPVITFRFGDQEYGICSEHLPVLLHKPGQLSGKLPGIENVKPPEGHNH